MDAAQFTALLEAHADNDRFIDGLQTIGIGLCAIGTIASTVALIYVANLLRVAAKVLTKDIRGVVKEQIEARARLDDFEARLNESRSEEIPGGGPYGGPKIRESGLPTAP